MIIEKLNAARDRKVNMQDIVHIEDVTNYKKKTAQAKKASRTKFILSQDFRIKVEWISDDEDKDSTTTQDKPLSGELDGHFAYPKTNENPAEMHSFHCDHCDGVFRDQNELRNHYTNHRIEFFQCLICDKIYRSVRAFEVHRQCHDELYVCLVCNKGYKLQTTLINHQQVHSEEHMNCSYPGCNKSFKHRQNQVKHVQWGHRDKKECPCTICGKLFQTPTNMRTHRL